MTPRRVRIYHLIFMERFTGPDRTFDAEAVYQGLRAADEPMPMSTIHSVLRDFVKRGIITRLAVPGRRTRYQLAVTARVL